MRNLKKFLALVLALMMVVSVMVTVSAAYKDEAKIDSTYNEAVQVLSALEVFEGDPDGSFRPQDPITRGEVAAILYRAVTGETGDAGKKAASIYSGSNYYTDVTSDKWFAGYVNYCTNGQLFYGNGGKQFDPDDNITGYQVLAMMLRAIGRHDNNDFRGVGYEIQAGKVAKELGITANITEGTLSQAATREQVAEMIFRAILAPTFRKTLTGGYTETGTVGTQDKSLGWLNFGLFSEGHRYFTSAAGNDTVDVFGRPATWYIIDADADGALDGNYAQIGAGTATDELLVAVPDTPVKTYTAPVSSGALYTALGLRGALTSTLYVDGAKVSAGFSIASGNNITTGGNGTLTEVYKIGSGYRLVEVNTYVGTITGHTDAVKNSDGQITAKEYVNITAAGGTAVNNTKFETTAFSLADVANGTVVIFTATSGTVFTIQSAKAAAAYILTPTTVYVADNNGTKVANDAAYFYAGGVKYQYNHNYYTNGVSGVYVGDNSKLLTSAAFNKPYDVYVDDYGYVVKADLHTTAASTGVYLILNAAEHYDGISKYSLDLTVLDPADGATKTVKALTTATMNTRVLSGVVTPATDVNADGTYKANDVADKVADYIEKNLIGTLVTYKVNAAGYAEFTSDSACSELTNDMITGMVSFPVNLNSVAAVVTGNANSIQITNGGANHYNVDSKTLFLVETYNADGSVAGYTSYTGIKNVPSLVAKTGLSLAGRFATANDQSSSALQVVLIKNATAAVATPAVTVNSQNYIYIIDKVPEEHDTPYDLYTVIQNGEVKQLQVYKDAIDGVVKAAGLYHVDTWTTDGQVYAVTAITTKTAANGAPYNTEIAAVTTLAASDPAYKNDIVYATGTSTGIANAVKYTLADNCVIMNTSGSVKKTSDIANSQDLVLIKNAQGQVAYVLMDVSLT